MEPGLHLQRVSHASLPSMECDTLTKLPYHSLIGCLLYLAIGTCLDISFAVQQLSQFLDCYSHLHWHTATHIVRYLKGTRHLHLCLGGNQTNLLGFTDSDWANCPDMQHSVGGYVFLLGSGVISWTTKKQKAVTASSCEAEYITGFEAAKEAIWLCSLLSGISMLTPMPTMILCDNNATIDLSDDPLLHAHVKHIDIKYHFLQERVQSREFAMTYTVTPKTLSILTPNVV